MASNEVFPKTILVLRFSPKVRTEALAWFVEQCHAAGLLVRCEPYEEVQGLTLHVTADLDKLLHGAEMMGIRKPTQNGRLRSLTVWTIEEFLQGDIGIENLLTPADKQLVVIHELEQLGRNALPASVPGYPLLPLPPEKSLFETYLEFNLILDYFPLHDSTELSKFGNDWIFSVVQRQPLQQIREYFGDGMSVYFSFLEFYTFLLLGPAVCGLFQFCFSSNADRKDVILGCLFNLFWGVIGGQDAWRREFQDLNSSWGSLMHWREGARAKYRNDEDSSWKNTKQWLKTYVASAGIILGVIAITATLLFFSLWFQTYLGGSFILGNLWAIADALIILVTGHYYSKFATFLTEWENHRTDADFEYHRIRKLVQFESLHNFLPLFYLAFWLQDLDLLRLKVNLMLLIVPVTSTVQETLYPLLFRQHFMTLRAWLTRKWPALFCWIFCDPLPPHTSRQSESPNPMDAWPVDAKVQLESLEVTDPRVAASREQLKLEPYETTFDDYLEIYVQFGYIFLFAGISPYAAILGFLSSYSEIRTDAYKLCKLSRRPLAKRIYDIGPWITAFEIIGIVSLVSNCWMLGVHSFGIDLPALTVTTTVFGFVLLLACKLCFRFLPDHHIRRPFDL